MNLVNLQIIDFPEGGGSEDFPFMMKKVQQNGGKACFIGFGAAINKAGGLHTNNFDFDEEILIKAVNVFNTIYF